MEEYGKIKKIIYKLNTLSLSYMFEKINVFFRHVKEMISDLRDIDKVMLNEIRIANEPYVVENVWEKIEIEPINVVIANGKE